MRFRAVVVGMAVAVLGSAAAPLGQSSALEEAVRLDQLVLELYEAGRYMDAVLPALRSLRIKRQALGQDHRVVARSLTVLGRLYWAMGAHALALPLLERAWEIEEGALGPNHPDTAQSLSNLATLHQATGAYDRAIPLYERSLSIWEKALGPSHLDITQSLNNLALLYKTMGAYAQALPLYERALRIVEENLGPEHRRTATTLNNLALLQLVMAEYALAVPLMERALRIRERVLGPDHPNTAQSLNNLGLLYKTMGAYEEARQLFHRALQGLETSSQALGSVHPDTRAVRRNLGWLYLAERDYAKAEDFFRRSQDRAGLVELRLARGRADAALALLEERPPTEPALLPYRAQYLTQHGLALAQLSRRAEAAASLWEAVTGIEQLRNRVVGDRREFFTAGGGVGYLRAYRGLVSVLAEMAREKEEVPAVLRPYGPDPASAAYYFAESTKARSLLETMASASWHVRGPALPAVVREAESALQYRLAALEDQWEQAYSRGDAAWETHHAEQERVIQEFDALIVRLRREHPLYAALHYPRPVPATELPLANDEVLLEYAVGEDTSYVFVVRSESVPQVVEIPLGREALEAEVQAFMAPLLDAETQGASFSSRRGKALYDWLLGEALAEVREDERVLIVPDGVLGLVPFEALVIAEAETLAETRFVGDAYALTYYQSATVLALQRQLPAPAATRPLFALGDPVFDADDPRYVAAQAGQEAPVARVADQESFAYRALATRREWGKTTADDPTGTELVYLPLPETAVEVRAIAEILGVPANPPDVLLDLQANETGLRQAPLQDYRYLHFATHADLPGKVQGIKEPFLLLGQVDNADEDDGFLTLSEVLELQLSADMVVLSACVTGRGQVVDGEGVVNFARAFQHAGAQSVVVSLWEVASGPAVEYMQTFYEHLAAGTPRAAALRQARDTIKARYPNPFYWAVFILHGEG